MNKINVLSESIANKIAAGEVIERVSSVVKELMENSIDASSKNISIVLKEGGLKKIEVIDDGFGMSKTDAKKAFERHATSKIKTSDDLFFISTLGFRGEALPSIASVSKMRLLTNDSKSFSSFLVENGLLKEIKEVRKTKGTTVVVENLFFNTPARLKFLKPANVELNYVIGLIQKTALANPSIKFSLINDEKEILKTTGSADLLKVIHEIYGLGISKNMLAIDISNDDFIISGYISKPEVTKSNRNHFHVFVNERVIKNHEINKAINDAYYTYKPSDKFPVIVLNVFVDPTLVDVNIHPTKEDIKLSKMQGLKEFLFEGVKDVLSRELLIPSAEFNTDEEVQVDTNFEQLDFDINVYEREEKPLSKTNSFKLYPVGLVHGTYIVAQNEEGLFIIDQHAAAERINYEYFKDKLKDKNYSTKEMLFPITIELSSEEYHKFMDKKEKITSLGFENEEFGINTIIIKTHPEYLKEGYEEIQTRNIIDLIINLEEEFKSEKFLENAAITLACKSSIKANTNISIEEQEYILDALMKTENPYTCPHGRPTIIKYTSYELEKLFKRVKL